MTLEVFTVGLTKLWVIFQDLFGVGGSSLIVLGCLFILYRIIQWWYYSVVGLRDIELKTQQKQDVEFLYSLINTKMIQREIATNYPEFTVNYAGKIDLHGRSLEEIEQVVEQHEPRLAVM